MPEAGRGTGRRRRQSRGDLKEAAILDSAWKLLMTKPMAEITVEELAAGADISRPSFYFYFDSRDAVIRALGENVQGFLAETYTGIFNDIGTDPEATFRGLARGFMQLWLLAGPVLRAFAVLDQSNPEQEAFWGNLVDPAKKAFAEAVESERAAGRALPAPPDASDLGTILTGMFWRAGYELSLAPHPEEIIERVIDTLTAVCCRAVYGETPRRATRGAKANIADGRLPDS